MADHAPNEVLDGGARESPFAPGDVIAGKYRIERVLAFGGMGVVLAARHIELNERVALKFLLPEALSNKEAVSRFAQESRAAVRIRSEHVARVIDVGTVEGAGPFMVMEYLEGEDLSMRLERAPRLAIPVAVEIILQASEAIAEAHSLGIVHRDLKPANLFLTTRADGSAAVKVLDFGISKIDPRISRVSASLTTATAVMGSPLYMAPEQMRASREVDARSDVWALGMILYEMIVGEAAFDGDAIPEICLKIYNDDPPSMRAARPDVPPDFERVVFMALEKDPAKRYETVGAFVEALSPYASERARVSVERVHGVLNRAGITTGKILVPQISAPHAITLDAAAMKAAATEVARQTTPAAWSGVAAKRTRRSPIIYGAAIGAVGLIGVIGWIRSRAETPPAPAAVVQATAAAASPSPAVTEAARPAQAAATAAAPTADPSAADDGDMVIEEPTAAPSDHAKVHRRSRLPAVAKGAAAPSAQPSASPAEKPASPNSAGLFDDPK